MRRAFTMIEVILAVALVGVLTALSVMTFNAVSRGWQVSTDYLDKLQRTDYAIHQVTSALRSMYYPHDGETDANYGFVLTDNGSGEDPRTSDVIEWAKTGSALVGTMSAVGDTVHRVQLMVLEEGPSDFRDADGRRIDIEVTGLYARQCPDVALRKQNDDADKDYTFGNSEMYEPVLVADGIVGFNCRVLPTAETGKSQKGENDKRQFEDEFDASNSVPYKVELTFHVADRDGRSYRNNTAPFMRIVRIPIHEQSLDGKTPPGSGKGEGSGKGGQSSGVVPGASPRNSAGAVKAGGSKGVVTGGSQTMPGGKGGSTGTGGGSRSGSTTGGGRTGGGGTTGGGQVTPGGGRTGGGSRSGMSVSGGVGGGRR